MNTTPSKIRILVFLFLALLLSGCNLQGRKVIPISTQPKSQVMENSTDTPRPVTPTNTSQPKPRISLE